jgi:hypothetical protein
MQDVLPEAGTPILTSRRRAAEQVLQLFGCDQGFGTAHGQNESQSGDCILEL